MSGRHSKLLLLKAGRIRSKQGKEATEQARYLTQLSSKKHNEVVVQKRDWRSKKRILRVPYALQLAAGQQHGNDVETNFALVADLLHK